MRLLGIIVAVIIIAGGAWYLLQGGNTPTGSMSETDMASSTPADSTGSPQTSAAANTPSSADSSSSSKTANKQVMSATLHTSMGDITIKFLPQQAPNTVSNFLKLAASGFYDGTKFHRVIKGFMDQGGDPLTKDDSKQAQWGTGGPGYTIPDEITSTNNNAAGTIAMANTGQPNSAGSQFFLNAVDNPSLNSGYTVFGQVADQASMSVVTAINNTPTDSNDRPLTPVVLQSITINYAQ